MTDDNVILVSLGFGAKLVLPASALMFLANAKVVEYVWDKESLKQIDCLSPDAISVDIRPRSWVPTKTKAEVQAELALAATGVRIVPAPDTMAVVEHAPPPVVEPVRDFVNEYRGPEQGGGL